MEDAIFGTLLLLMFIFGVIIGTHSVRSGLHPCAKELTTAITEALETEPTVKFTVEVLYPKGCKVERMK